MDAADRALYQEWRRASLMMLRALDARLGNDPDARYESAPKAPKETGSERK